VFVAKVSKSALVSHSAADMYALVNDIESYPRFLPWCRSTEVLSRNQEEIRATIEIAKGSLSKTFTTQNRLRPEKMIEIHLLDGPFRRLEGAWQFQELRKDACKVSLDLEFEFANPLVRMTLGPIFGHIADTMVDAFCKRAREVYG
jgi:ribosome-associated toxin RatA of RatAB toxin-antitoxin module